MSRFRDFLYLDERVVESLLSGVEGGRYDSTGERWSQSSEQVDRGNESIGTGDASNATVSEHERIVHQNAEARFSRLWNAIQEDPDEDVLKVDLNSVDLATSAVEGQFCRLTGKLSVPPAIAAIANSSELLQIGKLGEQFGFFTPGAEAMNTLESMAAMRDFIKETFPVILELPGSSTRVALPLDPTHSRVKIDKFFGRATVFGRIAEIIPRESKYTLFQLPGAPHLSTMSRPQRRRAEKAGKPTVNNEMELRGPVLVVRAIAIY